MGTAATGAGRATERAAPSLLEVDVLGPVQVRVDGLVAPVGGSKQLGVLILLALADGAPVPAEDLTRALWGTAPPPSAATTLRAYVSRLRTGVLAGRLERAAAGYVLAPDAVAVDAAAFRELVAVARTSEDVRAREAALVSALERWSGDPLGGLEDLPLAATLGAELAEERDQAREDLAGLLLARGALRECIDLATELVAVRPHREGPAVLLVTALARAGRPAEALEAYDHHAAVLADDLGLDPGPAMRDLQLAILRQDPTLVGAVAPPAPVGASAPAPPTRDDGDGAGLSDPTLPVALTSFIGRADEVAEVASSLREHRLVTLTGVGGAGKSRVAVEVVRTAAARDDVDGPWLVELAALTDPALVAPAICQQLGISTQGGDGVASLVSAVGCRPALVVLDNCEHVIDEVATVVEQVLGRCPELRVVATSREALNLPGERVHVLPSLTVGSGPTAGEAEQLLVARAGLPPGTATSPVVRRICSRLDGIPLALELAAPQIAVFGVEGVEAMLDDRFALLSRGSRTALPRHRTLAAAVAWSYDLLDPTQQRVLRVAAVREGTFDVEDLLALEPTASPALLADLVARSVVVRDERDGEVRFRLLETIKAFVRETWSPDEADRLETLLVTDLAARAPWRTVQLRTADDRPAWRWFDRSVPDLRAALGIAVRRGMTDEALALLAAMSWYWYRRGFVAEGRRWHARIGLPADADPALIAAAGLGCGALAYLDGDLSEESAAAVRTAVAAARTAGDVTLEAVGSCYLGYFLAMQGDLAAAVEAFDAASACARDQRTSPWAVAEVLMTTGQLLRLQQRTDDAMATLLEAQRVGLACGHRWAAGSAGWIAAKLRLDLHDTRGAARLLQPVLRGFLAVGDRTSLLAGAHTTAAVAAGIERHADGARLLGAVTAHGERIGYLPQRMDPVDAARDEERVRAGLTATELAAATLEGAALSAEQAVALADDVLTAAAAGRP